MEQVINPKSPGSFVRAVSGLFISKEHPHGLSPKECSILAALLTLMEEGKIIDKTVKIDLSNMLNQNLQVTTNYMNKFKQKGIVSEEGRLHPILFKNKITIQYEKD